jgi:acyl dehydratase
MRTEPFTFLVEAGKIHEFAMAVFDGTPDYHDAAAARARGLPGVMAPPTFAMAAGFFQPGGHVQVPNGIDVGLTLHGEQEFIYHRPLRAGDVLTGTSRLAGVEEKEGRRGGAMKLYTIETEYRDGEGAPVLTSRTVLIQTARAVPR